MIRRLPQNLLILATCLLLLGSGCMRLDVFLFNGKPVDDDVNLMEAAKEIPKELVEEMNIEAEDGTMVNAYMLRHEPGDGTPEFRHNTAILYCHGNKWHIQEYALRVQELWKLGYSVLIFDYRGYGKTKGTTTEAGATMDARASRAHLEEVEGFDQSKIALYGFSLGTAICTNLAAERAAPALALEAPFAAVKTMSNGSLGLEAPGGWFADSLMETVTNVTEHEGALLVMHGTKDTFVRPEHGQMVYDAAEGFASSRELWLIDGAVHGSVPCAEHSGPAPQSGCPGGDEDDSRFSDEYKKRITALFDAAFGIDGSDEDLEQGD